MCMCKIDICITCVKHYVLGVLQMYYKCYMCMCKAAKNTTHALHMHATCTAHMAHFLVKAPIEGITIYSREAPSGGITIYSREANSRGITISPREAPSGGITIPSREAPSGSITIY